MSVISANQDRPTIALHSLAGFAEDKSAAIRFERRFQPLTLGGAAIVFVGVAVFGVLAHRAQARGDASALTTFEFWCKTSFFLGCGLSLFGWRRLSEAGPISPQTGQRMEVYRLEDSIQEGNYELIYVCRKSRTYFRRVLAVPSNGA